MEKLVEVAEAEVGIEFKVGTKCRSNIHLRSLHPTAVVTFKVQTSSPHKFHVNPPNGILPPLSSTTLQVILRPQPQPPPSFPRSPSDRFLIKSTAAAVATTQDTKLKVAYVGPYLLRYAASQGNADSVRHILRRQRSLLSRLSPDDSAALARSTHPSVLNALLEAGFRIPPHTTANAATETAAVTTPRDWTLLHSAAANGGYSEILGLIEEAGDDGGVDLRDAEGRTPLHLAAAKGYVRCVRLLVERGADKDARSNDGRTALYRAAGNGDVEMVALLLELGADAFIATARGRAPLDVAREKGHQEVVNILERGEMVLTAARRGDLQQLESLLRKRVGVQSRDQYGITALHSAAIKGHRRVISLLVEFGMDTECRDAEGHTPLHLAVEGGYLETVELLIDMGADVNARSKRGATPLYLANSIGCDDISQLLLSRGASAFSPCLPSSSSSTATEL